MNDGDKFKRNPGDRLRILVVDDESLIVRGLQRMLSNRFDVTPANGGEQALTLLHSEYFDVVFCDLMMPSLTGMDVYMNIQRSRPELVDRFIFMTGGTFSTRIERFLDEISNTCLFKPFTVSDAESAILDVVGHSSKTPSDEIDAPT